MRASERRKKIARALASLTPYPDGFDSISDLLSDLMHLSDRIGLDFNDLLDTAHKNYEAEKA